MPLSDLLGSLLGKIEQAEKTSAQLAEMKPEVIYHHSKIACSQITPLVRSLLVGKVKGAGIHERTGHLIESLNKVQVAFNVKSGKIIYKFPSDVEPYKNNKTRSFYTVAASLSYGSVRSGVYVQKDRYKEKKAQGLPVKRQVGQRRLRAEKNLNIQTHGTIVKAKPFWEFSGAEEQKIVAAFMSAFRDSLNRG
jgi:hypothetical protein